MFNLFRKIFSSAEKTESAPAASAPVEGGAAQADKAGKSAAYKKQGNKYLAQGELEKAAECYRQAIAINHDHAEAHLNLGFVLKEQKRHEEAERALKQAVLCGPKMEDAYYLLAIVSQERGKLDEAIDNFNKAIELKPDFEIAYRDLSLALFQSGQNTSAKKTLLQAIALYPANADFHYYLGKLHVHEGESDQAIDCFLKALSIQPEFAEGHNDMGLALQAQDKLDAAVQSYQKALSFKSDYAEAHAKLGFIFQRQGKMEAAIESYRNALVVNPDFAIVHNNLASALQTQDKLEEAIEHLQKAVTTNPSYAEAHSNLGVALKIQGKLETAVECCQKSLSIDPDFAEAHSNLADALQALGKLDAAIESYHRALSLKPDLEKTHCNLGNVYKTQGKFDAAVEQYQQAISLKPDYANAHLDLGLVFIEQSVQDRAIQCFKNAISINPNFVDAHLNLSLSQLLIGNFEQGWAEFEWRWQNTQMQSVKYDYKQPLWLGKEPLSGKTILLHYEQGFGDTIQFCRYAKLVAAQGATVLLLVPAPLKLLLTGLEGVSQVLAEGEPPPTFDHHCPLMSLPLALSTRISTIAAEGAYLGSDPGHVSKWQSKLGNKTRPRIGFVWSGSQQHKNDHNRSIPLNDLLEIVSDQAQFVSLQKEIRPGDQPLLNRHITHFGEDLENFMDTAGLIANMDLVISVDTAVAHLAGAMGKPVWVLLPFNPDWRWMLERSDCPWYPSAKLFRQARIGDWNSVLSLVAEELKNTMEVLDV